MKKSSFKRLLGVALAICLVASMAVPTFAAESTAPLGTDGLNDQRITSSTIDYSLKGTVELYKIDFTNAAKDGVWSGDSYVSTGVQDTKVEDLLINDPERKGDTDSVTDLGNGNQSNGYAVKGVEFAYLKVADIVTYTEDGSISALYRFDPDECKDLLTAINLTKGDRFGDADGMEGVPTSQYIYFQSDVLQKALKEALKTNATDVKNALEAYINKMDEREYMPLTDANGYTKAEELELGLYLFVETQVPEFVTSTTNPFFLSVPMTTVDGGAKADHYQNGINAADGGAAWLYDITLYPKNESGIPSFEKTVREAFEDGGEHDNLNPPDAGAIEDGYKHYASASAGDLLQYQIISTLPSITSDATAIAQYNITDTLGAGLTYDRNSIRIEWFKDEACTQLIDTWEQRDDYFEVDFIPPTEQDASDVLMTISFTDEGLAEINKSEDVWKEASQVRRGFSDCTMRVTYNATFDGNTTAVYGDSGNCNKAVLTWRRAVNPANDENGAENAYFDTLVDDAHVFSYGIDLTKVFASDAGNTGAHGNFNEVEFVVWNASDGYWVTAEQKEEGIYYVNGHVVENGRTGHDDDAPHAGLTAQEAAEKAHATKFVPTADGKIVIKGLEDDKYILTEIRTSNGYTLLKDHIDVTITVRETDDICAIYAEDVLGVIQNDPRYASVANLDNVTASTVLGLGGHSTGATGLNIPQDHMEHHLLTASATVDGNAVTMLNDDTSVNALAPLTVVNTRGFDLPQTGEVGAVLLPLVGVMGMCGIIAVLFVLKKKEQKDVA